VPFYPLNLRCSFEGGCRSNQLGWRDIVRAKSLARITEKGMHSSSFVATRTTSQNYPFKTRRVVVHFKHVISVGTKESKFSLSMSNCA
jgi:hypothetical protein